VSKKWYNLFVSVDPGEAGLAESPAQTAPAAEAGPQPRSAAQAVAEIAATVAAEAKFTSPVRDPASFDQIYQAAEIASPAHGYSILKVAEMLASGHIRDLPPEVKRSSILVALDAAGVKVQEVIQDAVRRDRALDTFERVQQKSLEEMEARKGEENRQIQAEIDRLVAERRARIQANNDEVSKQRDSFQRWRLEKQREEQKIADAVNYFVTENPITTGGPAPAPPKSSKTSGA